MGGYTIRRSCGRAWGSGLEFRTRCPHGVSVRGSPAEARATRREYDGREMRCCLAVLILSRLVAGGVEFNRDVRPILSDKCYVCHGPDAAAKHVPFRLDSEAAAKAGHAIVEGNPDASELVKRTGA